VKPVKKASKKAMAQALSKPQRHFCRLTVPKAAAGNCPNQVLTLLVSSALISGCATKGGQTLGVAGDATGESTNLTLGDLSLPTQGPQSLAGKAINGYLDSAVVFVDLNQDGRLSLNEPVTLSRNGDFSIVSERASTIVVLAVDQLSPQERLIATQKLASVGVDLGSVNETTYRSESGEILKFSGRLESSVDTRSGVINVTPLSTFASSLQRSGMSYAEAVALTEDRFGVSPQLDYISNTNVSARALSQSLSSFYQVAGTFFGDQGAKQETLDALTYKTIELLGSLPQQTSMVDLFGSPVDLRSIVTRVASDLKIEVDLSSLSRSLSESFSAPLVGVGSTLRLVKDTGTSALDRITANPEVTVTRAVLADTTIEFGLSSRFLNELGEDMWSEVIWSTANPSKDLPEGVHRVYLRSDAEGTETAFIEYMYDRTAPTEVVAANKIFSSSKQLYFPDYVQGFTNRLAFTDTHLEQQQRFIDGSVVMNYLISSSPIDDLSSIAEDPRWSDTLNIYEVDDQERGFFVYSSLVDIAGNRSEVSFNQYRLDRLSPLLPEVSAMRLISDTGLYDWDWYTSSVNLEGIAKSLRIGDSPIDQQVIYRIGHGEYILYDTERQLNLNDLEDGSYEIFLSQIDRADNLSREVSFNFTLDRIAPDLLLEGLVSESSRSLGPFVTTQRLDDFLEWGQLGFLRIDSGDDHFDQSEIQWFDYNRPVEGSSYKVFYRVIDKAGNYSDHIDLGIYDLGSPTLVFGPQDTDRVYNIVSDIGLSRSDVVAELSMSPQLEAYSIVFSDDFLSRTDVEFGSPVVFRRALSFHSEGMISGAVAYSSYRDQVERTVLAFDNMGPLWIAPSNVATEFESSRVAEDNLIVLGSAQSDRIRDLSPGDLFIGMDGVDVACARPGLIPVGLAFLSNDELIGVDALINGFDPQRPQPYPTLVAPYAVYLSMDGTGVEGIAIVDSEIFSYGAEQDRFFTTAHNEILNRSFFIHDNLDSSFYYGGPLTGALGKWGNDSLLGGAGSDFLVGGASFEGGEDSLFGFSGNDVLVGGDYETFTWSKYSIDGDFGDDLIYMGNGLGVALGGPGGDTFFIAPIPSSTAGMALTILDFDPGADNIVFNVPNLSEITSSIFIDRDSEEVFVNLSRLFLQSGFSTSADALTLDSLLTINVNGLGDVSEQIIAETWFDFDGSYSSIWADLSNGWIGT